MADMITLPRATVQQALRALNIALDHWYVYHKGACAITVEKAAEQLRAALAQEAEPEPVACFIGMKGSAFDLPTTRRAYTYKEQPGNVVASKLGRALNTAKRCVDSIDGGLGLLQTLQAEGFGVFEIGAEYTAPPQRKPLTEGEIERHIGYRLPAYSMRLLLELVNGRAHGIGGDDGQA